MQNVSVRLEPETIEQVEQEAAEQGVKRAVYLRELIENRHESDEIQTEYEQLQAECERLQRRVSALIEQREEHGELVRYVEEERRLQQRREQRQQRREERQSAHMLKRLKWWALGWDNAADRAEG